MFHPFMAKLQLGKQGITPGFIDSVAAALKNRKQARVSVLPSTGRTKESMNLMGQQIVKSLPFPCSFKVIGFTIILIKAAQREK